MKKCVLVGVNAKYIHTNLAIRALKAAAPSQNITLCEVTINDHLGAIVKKLMAQNADCYGFSCYIWNMEMVIKVSEVLKKSRPQCVILWGGPEVSYDSQSLLSIHGFVDYIIMGEGEEIFPEFLDGLFKGDATCLSALKSLKGQAHSVTGSVSIDNTIGVVEDMDTLAFAYDNETLEAIKGKIIYYESMRGCPYRCAYCLSSTLKKVRFLPLERVYRELDFFIANGVKQVKFVDRTFNVDLGRTKAIIEYLIKKGGSTNFHFEIAGDLLDSGLLAIIQKAPKGLMQFEIGVQSTYEKTLEAITRKTDLHKIKDNVKQLIGFGNCHVHLDLIAGLPMESYAIFKASFNETMAIRPHMLQLGFLKLLKGTKIRIEADQYHYRYTSFPPYEVIENAFISADDLMRLKDIEGLVDRYYNAGAFYLTLEYIFEAGPYPSPFDFFEDLSAHWKAKGYNETGKSKEDLYRILDEFMALCLGDQVKTTAKALLKLDYLCQGHRSLPDCFHNETITKEEAFEYLKEEAFVAKNLPAYVGQSAKQIVKRVYFQYFDRSALDTAQKYRKHQRGTGTLCVFADGCFTRVSDTDTRSD